LVLHDFKCNECLLVFEELHNHGEGVSCEKCGSSNTTQLISRLSDWTGVLSMNKQYAMRSAPEKYHDSHITKKPDERPFFNNMTVPTVDGRTAKVLK
jgi:hypothetical protein